MPKPFIYQETQADKAAFMKRGDAWAVNQSFTTLAVADSPLRRLTIAKRDYPFDDLGGDFAQLFCDRFVEYSNTLNPDAGVQQMREILVKVNQDINQRNLDLNKAYRDNNNYDMGEVVGAGVTIQGSKLLFGLLEDCYVNVLRGQDLQNQIKIDYQIVKASKEIDRIAALGKLTDYMTPEVKELLPEGDYWEPIWCTHLRNNPSAMNDQGQMVGWGIFNGEESAQKFFQVGEVDLLPGDHILVFTDGMIPILEDESTLRWLTENAKPTFKSQYEFRQKITELLGNTSNLHKEKTLIYLKWEG